MSGLYSPPGSGGSIPSFSPGRILYADASGFLTSDANFVRNPTTGALTLKDTSGDELFNTAPFLSQKVLITAGTAANPMSTPGPLVKLTKIEEISAATQPNPAQNAANAILSVIASGTLANTPQVNGINVIAQGGGTTVGADVAAINAAGRITNVGATGFGMAAYLEGRRDVTTGREYGAEIRSANNTAQDGAYNAVGVSDTSGIWVSTSGAKSAAGVSLGFLTGSQWLYGFTATALSIRDGFLRDDSSATTSYVINGAHTNGIDMSAATISGAAEVWPNNVGLKGKDSAGTLIDLVKFTSANQMQVGPQQFPASSGELLFYGGGNLGLKLGGDGSVRALKNLLANTDNAVDIGASGANRFRDLYLARRLVYDAANTQTTVGVAGAAAALPATPVGYLRVNVGASTFNVPYYN